MIEKKLTKFEASIIITNIENLATERRILGLHNRSFEWINNLIGFKKFKGIDEFFKHYKSVDKLFRDLNKNYDLNRSLPEYNREYWHISIWVYNRVYALTKK